MASRLDELEKKYGTTSSPSGKPTASASIDSSSGIKKTKSRLEVLEEKYGTTVKDDVDEPYIQEFKSNFSRFMSQYNSDLDNISYFNSRDVANRTAASAERLLSQTTKLRRFGNYGLDDLDDETVADYWAWLNDAERALRDSVASIGGIDRDYAAYRDVDLEAGQQEVQAMDDAIALLQQRISGSRQAFARTGSSDFQNLATQYQGELQELQQQRSEKSMTLNTTRKMQEAAELGGVADPASDSYDPDFKKLKGYQPSDDETYEYINGKDNGNREAINRQYRLAHYGTRSKSTYQQSNYDYLTDDEISIYNYYHAKYGKERAEEYLDAISRTLQERANAETTQKASAFAERHPVLASAGSVATSLASGLDYAGQLATDVVLGRELGAETNNLGLITNSIRGAVAEQVDWEIGNWDAFDFLYNTAMSGADSLASGLLFGSAGGAVLGLSAAAQGTSDALERGMSTKQAFWNGLMSGVFEGLFETVSIGQFKQLQEIAPDTIKDFFKNLGKSMLVNASEESLTEIANIGYDTLVNGAFANYTLQELREGAWKDALWQVVESGLSGALMGVGMGTVGGAISYGQTSAAGRRVQAADQVARLQELGSLMSADSVAYELAGKVDGNTGAYTIGRLFNEVGATLTEQNQADIQRSLMEKGFTEAQAATNAKYLAKAISGETLTKRQIAALENNELLTDSILESLIEPNTTVYQRQRGYNDMLRELANQKAGVESTPSQAQTAPESAAPVQARQGQAVSQASQVEARTAQEQQTERATAYLKETNEPVAIQRIASTEGGTLTFQTEDGQRVSSADVDLGSMEPVYEAVAGLDVKPDIANAIVNGYQLNPELTPSEYAMQAQNAFRLGKRGIPMKQVLASPAANLLERSTLESIYGLGRTYATDRTSNRQQKVQQSSSQTQVKRGNITFASEDTKRGMTKFQQKQYDAIAHVARALGVDIVLHSSQEAGWETLNGRYDSATDTIHLNIDAGMDGRGTMMFTLAHELTHRIFKWSPAKFKKLADFLMEQYGEKGVSVEELIDRKLEVVRKTYEGQSLTEEQLHDLAFEEVVADSMEPMLTDGRVLQELKVQEPTIWEEIRKWVMEMAEKIRKAYARLKPDSAEGRAVLAMKDSIEQIEKLFLEGLQDSAQAAAGGQKSTAQEGGQMAASARYSIRNDVTDAAGNQYDQVVSLEYDVFNKIRRKPKTYIDFIRNHLIHEKITVFNSNGDSEVIEFAGEKERVTKDGYTNSHPVIGELLRAKNDIKKLVILNAVETAKISDFAAETDHVNEHSHQWLDENGWDYRTSYVMADDGMIYPVTLFIAKARDGRNILYDVNVKINEGIAAEKTATSSNGKQAARTTIPSGTTISQDNGGSQGKNQRFSVRYQERDAGLNQVNEALRTQKEGLREDFDQTKAIFKLLDIREKDAIFTQGSIEAVAKQLKQNAGATGATRELTGLLQEAFQEISRMENPGWADVEAHLQPAVDWMMEHQKKYRDPRAQEALHDILTAKVYLDKEQKAEAAYLSGNYNDYRRQVGFRMFTDKNSMSLDSQWKEWAQDYPEFFDAEASSTDMPRLLKDLIPKLRTMQTDMTFGIDAIGMEQDMLRQVYDGMIRAAVYPAQGQVLSWRDIKIQDLTREQAEKVQKLVRRHEQQMQTLKKNHDAEMTGIRENFERQNAWRRESREKTELRHRIQRTVKQLNSMLIRETKNRHIPEVLKLAVLDALDAVNMDTVMAEERLSVLEAQKAETSNPDVLAEIEERIRTVTEMGGSLKRKLDSLSAAYAAIRADADPTLSYAFDEEIGNQIQRVKDFVGDKPLRNMSKAQLEAVDELYTAVMTRVRDMNKAFATARQESIDGLGKEVISQELVQKQTDQRLSMLQPLRAFSWNNEKPVYAFERLGSATLTELYNNVRKGEDVYAQDMEEARGFQTEMARRFHKKDWDTKKVFTFKDRLGKEFNLTLGQMMTLYAYSKRQQAWDHLQYGGFQFAPETQILKQTKAGFEVAYDWTSAKTFKVDADILGDIVGQLTAEQKEFADRMQKYLSDTMGAKGNEISMKLYGIRLFKERNYFPLKSSQAFLEQEKNRANGEVKIKNKGFTKQVQKMANNPVMLRSFDDIWADHVGDMSMYHGFTLPLEDFYRVRNYKEGIADDADLDEPTESRSVVSAIQGAHGKEAVQYIEQLLKDLNGGAVGDPRAAIGKSLISRHKKAAVMASLSVVVQQPTSIFRAMALVDAKYFMPYGRDPAALRTADGKQHKAAWAELKQYAPVAILKEMGSFDTSVGRSGRDYLNAPEYDSLSERAKALIADGNYRDEVLGKAAAAADELAWVAIWNAVKQETSDKHRGLLKQNREEFMKVAGERFTEVISKTQVYDSVLSRSANMRSKDIFMNMATSFLAEPTVTANMVEDALRKWKKGDKKATGKIMAGVLASHVMNSMVVSLIYAMRDDDEDETFTEKYVSRLTTELIDGLIPLTYIPFARDIWSVFQGYDVNRADMTLVSDLATALKNREKLLGTDTADMDEEERQAYRKKVDAANWGLVDGICSLLGIPEKNFRRDVMGIKNFIATMGRGQKTTYKSLVDEILSEVQYSLPGGKSGLTNQDKLYGAIMAGDTAYVQRLKAGYKSYASYHQAVRKALVAKEPRILEGAKARNAGKETDQDKIIREVMKSGFSKEDVEAAINTVGNDLIDDLKKKDPRIQTAAEAKNAGNFTQYKSIITTIKREGAFTQDYVKKAVDSMASDLTGKSDDERYQNPEWENAAESVFDVSNYYESILAKKTKEASTIYDDLVEEKRGEGYLLWEAQDAVASAFTSKVKESYMNKDFKASKAVELMVAYGGLDSKEAAEQKTREWDFERQYGVAYSSRDNAYYLKRISKNALLQAVKKVEKVSDAEASAYIKFLDLAKGHENIQINATEAASYFEYGEPAGISVQDYLDYKENTKDIEGDDKQQRIWQEINALPLTTAQKDALYFVNGWSAKNLYKAPWH